MVEKLTGELGVELSQRKAPSEPCAEVFLPIAATCDVRAGEPTVRPNKPGVDKLKEMVAAWGDGEIV